MPSVHELGTYLREQRESARLSVRQLSELAGVSNPYLSQIERGLRKPSAEILGQLAKGLRISAESLYVRAGILEERTDQLPLQAAVRADSGLTERQKRVLLDIYESFRAENARTATDSTAALSAESDHSTPAPAPAPRRTTATPKAAGPARTSSKTAGQRAAKTTLKRTAAEKKTAVRATHPKES